MISPFIIPLEETLSMLGSTALAANKMKTFINIYLKTQFFSVLLSVVFVLTNIFLFKPLLIFLNFEDLLVEQCYSYFLNMIPYIVLESTLYVNFSFMNVLKSYKYIYYLNIFKLLCHFIACYFFIVYLDLSIFGIAYSFSVAYALAVLCSFYFCIFIKKDWKERKKLEISFEFSSKIFIGLKSFAKFALINIFLMLAEGWADEILNFFASKLSYDEFSVYSMVFEHLALFFSVEMGIGISASLIISKFLGRVKDSPNYSMIDMKKIINYTLIFTSCFFFFMYLLVYLLSDYNSKFYFADVKYQLIFAENLKVFSFVSYFQAMFLILQEIMVNLKNQQFALFNSILIGYGIKISLAYILMFWYNKGLTGIYFSVFVSSNIGIIFALISILNTNYDQLQKQINEEMASEEDKLEEEIVNQLEEE
jgi:Na+-driven multidrug efflux pump